MLCCVYIEQVWVEETFLQAVWCEMCSSCSQCFLCGCEGVKCVVLCLYRAGVGGDIPAGRVVRDVFFVQSVFSLRL